ncbi:MAG TPA: tetratricopeptide repeat protein [Kofleriaceae bacterium]|nr:tetratricopeptide repeat protein [Kofleriaceae bacterium]
MKTCLASVILLCALAVSTRSASAQAIDRDCPRGQVWDPSQGSCVKKKKPKRQPAAARYYEAIEHIEGTHKSPRPERGVALLEDACKQKHAPSCTLLGFLHLKGRVVPFNAVESLGYYARACQLTDPNGCLGAADIHGRGIAGKIDQAATLPFLEAACTLKSGRGCYELADKYRNALGTRYDYTRVRDLSAQALELLRADCAGNAGPSCHLLGMSYTHGYGTARDHKAAYEAFARGCASGSGAACYQVGNSARYGNGTDKNEARALEYFDRACARYDSADGCHDAGVIIAQSAKADQRTADENKKLMQYGERACQLDKADCDLIGYLYGTGLGGEQNDELANKWYLIGCASGSAPSCASAGHRAFSGAGTKKDDDKALELWQQACDLGWSAACGDLGEHLFRGTITAKDLPRAYKLFDLGCVRGDGDSCNWLAYVLAEGHDGTGKKNPTRAVTYYAKACDQDQSSACVSLGKLYRAGGEGLDKDIDNALKWLDRGCSDGDATGCTAMGEMYFRGDGVETDNIKAAHAYLRACQQGASAECHWIDELVRRGQGDAAQQAAALTGLEAACTATARNEDACMVVAGLYAWGGYVAKKNGNRAFSMFKAGCDRGHKLACVQLGHMYANGIGVVADEGKAKELFTAQCNGSVSAACAWLGFRLYEEKKYEEAAPLFRRACDDGATVGCTMLGYVHYTGRGVAWDVTAARKAYEKACEDNEPTACNNLGEMSHWGIATEIDLKKALELYQKACTPTSPSGCTNVGRFYDKALGVERDLERAETEYKRGCEEAEWGEACHLLAEIYKETGKSNASQIAALQQKALSLISKDLEDNPYRMWLLGKMHLDGIAMVKNPTKALELFVASCDGYDPLGCSEAGRTYMGDRGVPADYEAAAVRFDRACAAGLAENCELAAAARQKLAAGSAGPKPPIEVPRKGCGCGAVSGGDTAGFALLAMLVLLLIGRRRRRA